MLIQFDQASNFALTNSDEKKVQGGFERRQRLRIPGRYSLTIQNLIDAENALLRARLEKLERISFSDSLIDLSNTIALDHAIARGYDHARATGESFSIAVANLTHFKSINDHFGHVIANEVLCQTGSILRLQSRISDLCARYGAEEFVILLPGLNRLEAVNICQRLCAAVESSDWSMIAAGLSVMVSIGISDVMLETPAAMFALADAQLCQATQEARNREQRTQPKPDMQTVATPLEVRC